MWRAALLGLLRDISVSICTVQLAHFKNFLLNCLIPWPFSWLSSLSLEWWPPSPEVSTCWSEGSESSGYSPQARNWNRRDKENPRPYPQNIHGVHSGFKSQAMEFHSSYLSKCLFFQVLSVLFLRLCLLSLCQHYLFLSDWEGNMTDHLQTQGQMLPLTIFGARVSWETGASSQYTGVVMESGDIWERRCSPTASSTWGINVSMTCSVWKFPSSPVGQGQLMSSLPRKASFTCFFRAKMVKKTWPRRVAFF